MASGCRLSCWPCTSPLTMVRWDRSKLCPHVPHEAISTVTSSWGCALGSLSVVTAPVFPSFPVRSGESSSPVLVLSTMGSRARELQPEPPFVSLHLPSLSGAL